MVQRRVQLECGYVLHRRPYRDTSLLAELWTVEQGRVGVVVRGARRAGSGLAGLIQPFRPLLLSWAGRGELASLSGAEADGPAPWLQGAGLLSGFYLNELLMRMLQRYDPHAGLYAAYVAALHGLMADPRRQALEGVLRVFEKRLLEELGYGLVLDSAADTGAPVEPEVSYVYHFGAGPMRANKGDSATALRVWGRSLLALAREQLDEPESLRDAKRLMRGALAPHLGDKPLHSRRLFAVYRDRGS